MYNTTIICTYNTDEIFEKTDSVTDEEKYFIRDLIYRQELLNILGLEEYDDIKISKIMNNLFIMLKDNTDLIKCMSKLASDYLSTDLEIGLAILFSFDYLFITHKCVSQYLNEKYISIENINELKSNIKY